MEKLLELMNDYAHTYADHYDDTGEEITITFFSHADNCFQYVCDGGYETLVDDVVISKRFGFISWLVENDKIDFNKDAFISLSSELGCTAYDEKIVLMVLSISNSPIDDLISYLR